MTDAALNSTSGLTLTNENYGKASTILKKQLRKQASNSVNAYGKISKFKSCIVRCKLTVLRKLFNEIKSNVRSLESEKLRIATCANYNEPLTAPA